MAYTNAIFYIDLVSGSDTARTALTSCTASNPSGTITRINKTGHGLVTGAVVTLTLFSTWLNSDWKITWVDANNFDLDSAVWQTTADASGTCTPFGGSSWTDAWKTITSGATAARIAPGDEIRVSKTPNPVSIGNATWTNCQSGGGFPATKAVSATANNGSGLIRVTTAVQDWSTNDVIQFISVGGTLEANGAWVVNVISTTQVDLVGSVYTNAWTSGGTAQKINSKAVVLATAQTLEVNRCKSNWSNGVDGTSALFTTDHKEGGACVRVTLDSSVNTNSKQAYQAITIAGATANGYQGISFWFKNSAAIANATTWYIGLCSDNAGATVIDTFPIPAIASTGRWVCLKILRSGGGNLGGNTSTAIGSIAIWSGATAPNNSSIVYIDNFEAVTTNGLNHTSLISKNGNAQGGDEGYYGIQSIHGKVVLLDNEVNCLSNAGRGYSTQGTSPETVATYIRESFRSPSLATATATIINTINDSGTITSPLTFNFGYNISTGNCDGETFWDGGNGFGYCFSCSSGRSYLIFNSLSATRFFSSMVNTTGSNYNTITLVNSVSNCSYGVAPFSFQSGGIRIEVVNNANNNQERGVTAQPVSGGSIGTIKNANNNNTTSGAGVFIDYATTVTIDKIENAANNAGYGVVFGGTSNCYIKELTTRDNAVAGIGNSEGINFIRNATINESTVVGGMYTYTNSEIRSIKEDGVEGNNWTYYLGATCNWQTTEKQGSDPGSWKVILTNAARRFNFPVKIKLDGIQCAANKLVTVIVNAKKDHATNIINQLHVYPDTVRGIGTVAPVLGTATTSWETITLTFTPTNECIAEVFYEVYSAAGSLSNAYLGSISITQAP